jgi:ligand-binding sensor domain-containing protein
VSRSTDQGQSWQAANGNSPSGLPPNAGVQALGLSNNTLFAGLFGNGVYRSSNDGASWTLSGLAGQNINALKVSGAGVIFAGTDAGAFRSNDQGASWQPADLNNQRVVSLAFSGNRIFAGTYGNGVYVSSDNGVSWTLTGSNSNGLGNSFVTALTVGADGVTLFAGTDGRGIYRSTDGGASWMEVNNDLPPTLNVYSFAVSENKLYAGSVYGVFLSEDNGAKWKQLNAGLLDIYVTSLAVSDKTLIAGTRVGGVFISQIP